MGKSCHILTHIVKPMIWAQVKKQTNNKKKNTTEKCLHISYISTVHIPVYTNPLSDSRSLDSVIF